MTDQNPEPVNKAAEEKTLGAPGVPLYGGYVLENEQSVVFSD